jgi:hypothetical protein
MLKDDFPIVGQPAECLFWYPTAMIRCNCNASFEGRTLMSLIGIGNSVACPQCKKLYTIVGLDKNGSIAIRTDIPGDTQLVM